MPGRPHRTAQHRVGRRENVFVAEPGPRPRQQGRPAVEPQRFVFEEPRQPVAGGGVDRAQTQVLTDALLMLGDRLLPALVGVDRLGVGSQTAGARTSGSLASAIGSGRAGPRVRGDLRWDGDCRLWCTICPSRRARQGPSPGVDS